MVKKIDWIEFFGAVAWLLSLTALSLYQMSDVGILKLSNEVRGSVWAFAENSLCLTLVILGILYFPGFLRLLAWASAPYFLIKMVYHFSCYSGLYLLPKEKWQNLWAYISVFCLILSLLYIIYLIRKKYVA
jgi:hypothetical protein